MDAIVQFIFVLLQIYILCFFAWALLSWLPMISPSMAYNSTVRSIQSFLDSIILPYVKLFKFIKPVQIGGAMVDLSSIVAIIVLLVLQGAVLPQLLDPLVS